MATGWGYADPVETIRWTASWRWERHAHTKWTTGSPRHHAVATRFSQIAIHRADIPATGEPERGPDSIPAETWYALAR